MAETATQRLLPGLALVVGLLLVSTVYAVPFQPREFASDERKALYYELIAELRCLVCQNQNLAESNAELAGDLRDEVYRMLGDGNGRDEIVDFMVERYGDFVLYRPPLRPATVLLWVGPFLLAAGGLLTLLAHLRRRTRARVRTEPLSKDELQTIEQLVGEDDHQPRSRL